MTETDDERARNIAIAKKLLEGIAGGQDPDAIAALFNNNLVFEIRAR